MLLHLQFIVLHDIIIPIDISPIMPNTVSKSKNNLQNIISLVSEEMEVLENRLLHEISTDSRVLCSIMQDIFKAGGKRLRPLLSFYANKIIETELNIDTKADSSEKLYLIAEISELIHTASLVHDDIIDNALIRRGRETTNSKWDNAITVISGDFMFARAAVNLGKLECNEIVKIFAAVLEYLCDGEIEQVERKYSCELDFDYYFQKSFKKTGSLFEAAAKAPAALHKTEEKYKSALAEYGRLLGIAFQVVDDILDFTSDEKTLGKPAGSDVKEGQITLPVLYALEESKELKAKIEELSMDSSNTKLLNEILELIHSTNGIERSKAKAQSLLDSAIAELDVFKDSKYKQGLVDLALFISERNK